MPYAVDFPAAARRHLAAADSLSMGHRRDVAGYLYGLAAECALKAMMREAGLQFIVSASRRDDPFWAHFPELRTLLRDALQGRRGTPLVTYVQNEAFMSNWSTRMRYSNGRDIRNEWIAAWQQQARQAVASLGT